MTNYCRLPSLSAVEDCFGLYKKDSFLYTYPYIIHIVIKLLAHPKL